MNKLDSIISYCKYKLTDTGIYIYDKSITFIPLKPIQVSELQYNIDKNYYNSLTPYVAIILFVLLLTFILITRYTLANILLKLPIMLPTIKVALANIHSTLNQHFYYYRNLSTSEQQRFTKRVYTFEKKIIICDSNKKPTSKQYNYLISATAVQLTFGLSKITFNHFTHIILHPTPYLYHANKPLFVGHVIHNTIHLSMPNYIHGISNLTDNDNVGLHEMAHALVIDCTKALHYKHNRNFLKAYKLFKDEVKNVFTKHQLANFQLLGEYAATNFSEFWAVSVEVFFEQPKAMQQQLPILYLAIAKLLKQQPC